jgi:hypothetical protein
MRRHLKYTSISRYPSLPQALGGILLIMEFRPKSFIRILIKRSSIFVLVLSLLCLILYLIGNFQHFLDESQLLLLNFLSWFSVISLILSLYGFCLLIAFFIKNRKPEVLLGIVGYLIIFAYSTGATVFTYFIRSVMKT